MTSTTQSVNVSENNHNEKEKCLKRETSDLHVKLEKESLSQQNYFESKIINSENINTFESITYPTKQMKLLYRMTKDGGDMYSMKNKMNLCYLMN